MAEEHSERKFFPGYVLVEMDMTDDTWHLVKNHAKSDGIRRRHLNEATPISEKEVKNILHQIRKALKNRGPRSCSKG